ncbi:MAG: hypothetical protein KKA70_10725 [Proteobacteria bacterium]|nr:hypothetical protein [Pseudomonadota bacterium]
MATKGIFPDTPQRITWGSELATGYDRLKVGFYVHWEKAQILEILDNAKIESKETNDSISVSFSDHGDQVYNCHPTGRKGGYAYHISRADVHIFFSRRKDHDTPNVWLDIGSLSCWSPGYKAVLDEVKRLITDQGGFIMKDTISELHLCADFIGLAIEDMPIDTYKHWITRANHYRSFQEHSKFSGISISQTEGPLPEGSPDTIMIRETGIELGQGDIMLRIYDKVLEIKRNPTKQSVFSSVWNKEQYNETPVTRVEFQIRRQVLKQMKVHSLSDLDEKKSGIWRYCTQHWTRLTQNPVDRKNRHQDRATSHPWWHEVQQIKFNTQLQEIVREKIRSSKDIDVLVDMVAGCALSIGIIMNRKTDDLEGVIAFGQAYLEKRIRKMWKEETERGQNLFIHKMKKRWAEIWPVGYQPQPV